MPYNAAQHVLSHSHFGPFERWTPGLVGLACRHQRVSIKPLFKFLRDTGLPEPVADWDAQTIVFDDGSALIVHRHERKESRLVWTLAHELGHFVLGHPPGFMDPLTGETIPTPGWCEREADAFASHLLLPEEEMRAYAHRGWTVDQVAKRKNVSISAVMIRMRTMRKNKQFYVWAI